MPRGPYSSACLDQQHAVTQGDVLPADLADRAEYVRSAARSATVYGLASVLQFVEMAAQALDRDSSRFVGFNTFIHDREMACPAYAVFTTPNADTLYSNAWLTLSAGPVLLEIPEFGDRYFTVSLLDQYSNAVNLSTRTVGGAGGRYLIANGDWDGEVPESTELFRVATPHMWVLVRIFCGSEEDPRIVHELQDRLRIIPANPEPEVSAYALLGRERPLPGSREEVLSDWIQFFGCLDLVLAIEGHPVEDHSSVRSWRTAIGIGTGDWDPGSDDVEETSEAIESGFHDAIRMVESSRHLLGNPIPGVWWNRGTAGRYGTNHLRRAVANFVGLGATTPEENQAFTTFRDGSGNALDAGVHRYLMSFDPPPVDAFWSVTVYDADTRRLVDNPLGRYSLNSSSDSLAVHPDGTVSIVLSSDDPERGNWLPCPRGRFYVAIRAYLPGRQVREGEWVPQPIRVLTQ